MMSKSRRFAFGSVIAVVSTFGCTQPETQEQHAFAEWGREQAIVIEHIDSALPSPELASFKEAVGDARVVGIGESRHDAREQVLMKGLLVRHLIEDLGFRALILEESYPHALAIDDFVTSGDGDLREIMNGLAGWYLWDTEEMLEVVQWVRDFNKDRQGDDQVRVFGIDVTAPAPGVSHVLRALEYAGIDADVDELDLGLELQSGDNWPVTWQRYTSLSDERKLELAGHYDALVSTVKSKRSELVSSSSEQAYGKTLLLAEIGQTGNEMYSLTDRAAVGEVRERGMADTASWILENEVPGGKAVIWAANLHVAKSSFTMPDVMADRLDPMGKLVFEELGDAYISIGATFGSGRFSSEFPPGEREFETMPADTMDGACALVGEQSFLIDLRKSSGRADVEDWLQEEREWRAQGFQSVIVPSEAFDIVFYVSSLTRSEPTPMALRKFSAMVAD